MVPREPSSPTDSLAGHQILIAFNPHAGSGERSSRVFELADRINQAGFEAKVCPEIDALVELADLSTARQELRGVIAAGGDGTFSLVANRLPPATALAGFPLGTENLLARYLGYTSETEAMVELFRSGRPWELDAGQANGRLFTLMAGCGFDAEVVERLHRTRSGHIRHWNYLKPILSTIRTYAYPRLTVHVESASGEVESIQCRWAFVVNVPRYALGIQLDPSASPCDGLLNVITFRDGSLLKSLWYLAAVLMGSHASRDDVCLRCGCNVRIESEGVTSFQIDGDPGGTLPVEIRCLPKRLRVIVSPEWLASQPAANLNTTSAASDQPSTLH